MYLFDDDRFSTDLVDSLDFFRSTIFSKPIGKFLSGTCVTHDENDDGDIRSWLLFLSTFQWNILELKDDSNELNKNYMKN
jgi:hypothetical protein